MARIIEICGSPGVGKSTIFKEINRLKKKNDLWTTASNINPWEEEFQFDFFQRILMEIIKGPSKSIYKETQLQFIKRIYKAIKRGRNYGDKESLKTAGERFIALYPQYIEACWNNINLIQRKNINGMDLRFEKTEWIYTIIKKIQIIKEIETSKCFIIDEGLINMIDRALFKSENSIEEQAEIEQLLEIMPLPDAIVYIETDLNENIKRLKGRMDVRGMHKGLQEDNLNMVTKICRRRLTISINYMKKKNLPVLYINSSNKINENVVKIIEFTNDLTRFRNKIF